MLLPEVLRKRLVFGDDAQYRALKALEEAQAWCDKCDGEGTIQIKCDACDGTGENADDDSVPVRDLKVYG